MTDDEARALGERWVKAGGGYGQGWLVQEVAYGTTARLVWKDADHWHAATAAGAFFAWLRIRHEHMTDRLPDLRDPATRGAALEVVRERWARPIFLMPDDALCRSWGAYTPGVEPEQVAEGDSEAAALVAALEACAPDYITG